MDETGTIKTFWDSLKDSGKLTHNLWCLSRTLEPIRAHEMDVWPDMFGTDYLTRLRKLGLLFRSEKEAREAGRWVKLVLKDTSIRHVSNFLHIGRFP